MRLLLVLLLVGCAGGQYQFERSLFQQSGLCEELVGVWYSDYTATTNQNGLTRHISKITRYADGSGYMKGVSFLNDLADVNVFEFPIEWRCDGFWYSEKNEWGYTAFKIRAMGEETRFIDEREYMGPERIEFYEVEAYEPPNHKIRDFLGL